MKGSGIAGEAKERQPTLISISLTAAYRRAKAVSFARLMR